MDINSPVKFSLCEATPGEQKKCIEKDLLLLSEVRSRTREVFEKCLETENCEAVAAIREMIINTPDRALVESKSNLLMTIDSVLLKRKKGIKSKLSGVEDGVQVDFHDDLSVGAYHVFNGKDDGDLMANNGGFRVSDLSGSLGEEEESPFSKGDENNTPGVRNDGLGGIHDAAHVVSANATVSFDPPKGVDSPVALNAAPHILTSLNPNPKPNPVRTSVPLGCQNNYNLATAENLSSAPLHGLVINENATTQGQKIYQNAPAHPLPSVPLHASNIHQTATPADIPSLHAAVDVPKIEKEGLLDQHKKGVFPLFGELQKHLSKGGLSTIIKPQRFHASGSNGIHGSPNSREGEGVTEKSLEDILVLEKEPEARVQARNYAQVLNGEKHRTKVTSSLAKPIEIPYYPENLNKQAVRINSESLKKGADQWINCVVGKFIVRKPPSNLVRSRIMALWQKKGLISIMEQEDEFIFKFDTADQRNHILESRVWVIAGQQMIISGWLEENAYITSHFTKFPIWVKLLKVPPICWTKEGIGQIASTIGKPLVIDEVTATRQYMNYARVKIEVGAAVERPKVIQVELDDNVSHEVLVHYTGCPPSCIECNVFGHYTSKCPKKGGQKGEKKMGVNVTMETGEGEKLGDKKMGVNISVETKEDGGERKIEEASNLKMDEANEEVTSAVRRQVDDEAQTRTEQNGKQEMARSEESSSTDTNANSQVNQVVEKPTPEHHVKPNLKDLSKSQKKKLKKAKHGKGGGVNGRSPDGGDTLPD